MLDGRSHIPLYRQIEADILAKITEGVYGSYARVPSEANLSSHYHVSRMTARKALDRLVADGVLFRQPGKGTFVAPRKIAHRASTQLSFSAAMSALGLRVETRVLAAGVVPASVIVAQALGLATGGQTVRVRRLRLVEGEPTAIHTTHLPILYASILERDLTRSLAQLILQAGARLDHAVDAVEAVLAGEEEALQLRIQVGDPLLRLEGVGYTENEQPLRYTDSIYRADRFRFSVDTSGPGDLRPQLKSGVGDR